MYVNHPDESQIPKKMKKTLHMRLQVITPTLLMEVYSERRFTIIQLLSVGQCHLAACRIPANTCTSVFWKLCMYLLNVAKLWNMLTSLSSVSKFVKEVVGLQQLKKSNKADFDCWPIAMPNNVCLCAVKLHGRFSARAKLNNLCPFPFATRGLQCWYFRVAISFWISHLETGVHAPWLNASWLHFFRVCCFIHVRFSSSVCSMSRFYRRINKTSC